MTTRRAAEDFVIQLSSVPATPGASAVRREATALRLARRRGHLADRHPGLDDRAAVLRAHHDRQPGEDRPRRRRRDAAAGRAQGARRPDHRPGRRAPGRDHLRLGLARRGRRRSRSCTRPGTSRSRRSSPSSRSPARCAGPVTPRSTSMTPTLAATADVPLERVTGLSSTVERTASMLGAALAGGLVAVIGPANALVVDAASFGVSALLLAWAVPARTRQVAPARPRRGRRPGAVRRAAAGGLAVPARRPGPGRHHRDGGAHQHDRPRVVGGPGPGLGRRAGGGAAAVGALFATFAGASAVGSLVAAAYGDRLPRYATYLVCFLVTGLPRFVLMARGHAAVGHPRLLRRGRLRLGLPQPDPRRGDLRAGARAPDRPGQLAVDRLLLRADAARRPGRRLPGRRRRPGRGHAGLRRGVLRGDHAPGGRPAVARPRPPPGTGDGQTSAE